MLQAQKRRPTDIARRAFRSLRMLLLFALSATAQAQSRVVAQAAPRNWIIIIIIIIVIVIIIIIIIIFARKR